ncbi:tripartite tricarboxylate transporter substrate binding protein [Telmatospirillum sp. J64-1]|uniref:Bug family tripartite tricarboxylate transporter substrate binding protein n=1 Tax=Telmatospirillum sp. J64-1 TaxID=2502183 RepID=UPI00115D975C|nr:tripartite tricarboxylate transporter substrate binding protein [Telmatospirillum sp. J64-1]
MFKHARSLLMGLTAAAALSFSPLAAQAFPDKPIQYIIPFGPGGESDIAARFQEPLFRKLTGQDLVIQYRPGAGGATAWSQLNSMPADGHTIVGSNFPHIFIQPMEKDVGYKTEDVDNVYIFHYTPDALIVPADSPYQTLQDLIDAAKERPGALTFSGSGTYSANHIAAIKFDQLAGIKTTYVPFGGTGPSNSALLGKQVTGSWGYTTVAGQLGDQVRMLAVATDERHPQFPDVPTFKELGFDMVGGAYRGIAVPKSTPVEIKRQLSDLIGQINKDPEMVQKMVEGGFVMVDIGLDEMPEFMAQKAAEYTAIATEMGIVKQ